MAIKAQTVSRFPADANSQPIRPASSDRLDLMVAVSCTYCLALFAEMRTAIIEAGAIIEDIQAQFRAGDLPKAHAREWWLNARHRWLDASTDLTNHFATHSVNPTYFGQENGSGRGLTEPKPR